jgi:outer membrane receptor protein involved in Fe transport
VFEIPATNLAPEKTVSIETGVKIYKQKFTAVVTAFHSQLTNIIDRVGATYQGSTMFENRNVFQKQNVGEAYLLGAEAEAEVKFNKAWLLSGNITYTYGENVTKNEPMRRVPPLFGRAALRYNTVSGFWCKVEWALAGDQSRLANGDKTDVRIASRLVNGEMPGWNILNVYSGVSYKSVSVFITAQNLFDRAYRVYASGIDGYGRSVSTTLSIKL